MSVFAINFLVKPFLLLHRFSVPKHLYRDFWCIGWDDAFWPEGRRLESLSSRRVEILGKSVTYSCLERFGV